MNRKPVSFNGIHLAVPQEWDLASFTGSAEEGVISLHDGDHRCLEVAWRDEKGMTAQEWAEQAIADPDVEVKRSLSLPRGWTGYLLKTPAGKCALAVLPDSGRNRLLTCRLFRPGKGVRETLESLLAETVAPAASDLEPWAFFHTAFVLHRDFRFVGGDMRSGCIRLEFERDGCHLVLWDLALFVTLEKRGTDLPAMLKRYAKEIAKHWLSFGPCTSQPEDESDFEIVARRSLLTLSPLMLFGGRRPILLKGVACRGCNRYAMLYFRHRDETDREWLRPMMESLRARGACVC